MGPGGGREMAANENMVAQPPPIMPPMLPQGSKSEVEAEAHSDL
jgi:hypothetical protein